jgi:hypothetical protein
MTFSQKRWLVGFVIGIRDRHDDASLGFGNSGDFASSAGEECVIVNPEGYCNSII